MISCWILLSLVLITQGTRKDLQNVTTIVEANHFYSKNELFTNYVMNKVAVNYPLAVIIKPPPDQPTYSNHIEIDLKTKNTVVNCPFKSYNDLCVLEKAQADQLNMHVQCSSLPCEIFHSSYQAPMIEALEVQKLNELYKLDQKFKHMLISFKCSDPDFKDYGNAISIYSNAVFEKFVKQNIITCTFKNSGKGYLYVQATKQAKACTNMHIVKVNNTIGQGSAVADFLQGEDNIYTISKPQTDIQLDIELRYASNSTFGNIKFVLSGKKDNKRSEISTIYAINSNKKEIVNLDIVYSKQTLKDYTELQLSVNNPSGLVIIRIDANFTNDHEIQVDENGYYHMIQGESIQYRLVADPVGDQDKVEVALANDNGLVKSNQRICQTKKGCEVTLTASQNISASIEFKLLEYNDSFIDLKYQYTGKVRQGESLYFLHKLEAKKELQITINSQNVIVYVGDDKCKNPNSACNIESGNSVEPIYIESEVSKQLYIAVFGLDNARFSLRLINFDDYVQLNDAQPFSYTLKKDKAISFRFTMPSKTDVDFNLIAPANTLLMYLNNDENEKREEGIVSGDGFISLKKKQLKGTNFIITLEKLDQSIEKVHFTLIASTAKAIIPLESSVTHYQTLQKLKPKTYIIQYKMVETNVVLFFINNRTTNTAIDIAVKIARILKDIPKAETVKLDTSSELIDLAQYADTLCSNQTEYCELYMQVTNKQNTDTDVTINFLSQNAILQLKDGMWQQFPISAITTNTAFYFIPKHKDKSITIMYNNTYKKLGIIYKLWKMDKTTKFDPSSWPFPVSTQNKVLSQIDQVIIGTDEVEQCWPDCVVLIALSGLNYSKIQNIDEWEARRTNDLFNIMATNDVLELIENQKLDIILHKDELKQVILDIKPFLDKAERLTFFSYFVIGQAIIRASLSSSNKPRTPSSITYDFALASLESQFSIAEIKNKITELGMDTHKEIVLKILISPFTETKMSLQFSSNQDSIKTLRYDSSQNIKLKAGQKKMLQLIAALDYRIKIIRTKGFPFLQKEECSKKDLETCINQMTNLTQFNSKNVEYVGNNSTDKIVVIKIEPQQDIQIDVYILSRYGQIQLREGLTMNDFGLTNTTNSYKLVALKTKQTIVTINVLEGDPEVRVVDYGDINIKRKKKGNLIHISIPPRQSKAKNQTFYFGTFGLNNIFETIFIHIDTKSLNSMYTISYTSGDRSFQLEDGFISTALIQPSKDVRMFYISRVNKSIITTISFGDAKQLESSKIKLSYYADDDDEEHEIEQHPVQAHQKTPHPTVVFKLVENYKHYYITIENTGTSNVTVSVVVNENQTIILPYNQEFPLVLTQNESQKLITEIRDPGYMLIIVRRCDQGIPQLSYTFDQQAAINGDYQFVTQIKQDARQQIFVKATAAGALHTKLTSDANSTISIEIKYYKNKTDVPKNNAKLSKQGIVEYALIDTTHAEITFNTLQCSGKCSKFVYTYIISANLTALSNQLVCPSQFFTFTESSPIIKPQTIKTTSSSNETTTFSVNLASDTAYLGIKAVGDDGRQFVYKTVEMTKGWTIPNMPKGDKLHNFIIVVVILIVLLCMCIFARRMSRSKGKGPRKYNKIESQKAPIANFNDFQTQEI